MIKRLLTFALTLGLILNTSQVKLADNYKTVDNNKTVDMLLTNQTDIQDKHIENSLFKANQLPKNVINNLYKNNYKISLQNESIFCNNGKCVWAAALTNLKYHTITLAKQEQWSKTDILGEYPDEIDMLHEIGHTWDTISFRFSNAQAFTSIFTSEHFHLFNTNVFKESPQNYLNYYNDYCEEYFAECFALYFLNSQSNNLLHQYAPLTWNYIKNCVK